jgi:beta-mannosidase
MKIKSRFAIYSLLIFAFVIQVGETDCYSQNTPKETSVTIYDANTLDWKLWGYRPESWRANFNFANFTGTWAEYIDIPVDVPGSVQNALLKDNILSDWNYGTNNTAAEWVENRHWLFTSHLPNNWLPKDGEKMILHCDGLDTDGILMINGKEAGNFNNAFIPHSFDITPFLKEKDNTMVLVFTSQPDYLGQVGYTSKITDWKPRFNYGWDWVPRIVQIGIWDDVWISVENEIQPTIENIQIIADANKTKDRGTLKIKIDANKSASKGKIVVSLTDKNNKKIIKETVSCKDLNQQKTWNNLRVKRWWPNGFGDQPLYNLTITLLDKNGSKVESTTRKIGFRNIEWLPCEGASDEADPWICSVNNKPVFLQGINWTPILPNFADLKEEDYRSRLTTYKNLGVNTIRVWGGGFPEKEWLYDICDEMGIFIWQDFPLSSSGLDNFPPEGKPEVFTMSKIVRHYVSRLQHRPSILLWCGGNELYTRGDITTVTDSHVMIAEMKEILNAIDPSRKFTYGSPSGPNIYASRSTFGSGNNWDTHGPWKLPFTADDKSMEVVKDYWSKNDALFVSEAGVPGAMSAEMIKKYAGDYNPLPANIENPIWRNVNWWIDWDEYVAENNEETSETLEEYVNWSQKRQSDGLTIAVKSFKDRFPRCGGFLIWMGHDCFPCMVNTSIIDFEGNPKPSAIELSKIWKDNNLKKYKPNN